MSVDLMGKLIRGDLGQVSLFNHTNSSVHFACGNSTRQVAKK